MNLKVFVISYGLGFVGMVIGSLLAAIIVMEDCFPCVISFTSFALKIPLNYLIPFLALIPSKYISKTIICITPSLILNLFIIILLLSAAAKI